MAPKVYTGPLGGKYMIVRGRKVYLKGGASRLRGRNTGGSGTYRAANTRGRGAFWDDAKKVVRKHVKPFERIGSRFGPVGAGIGKFLGNLTGLGTYKRRNPKMLGMIAGDAGT